MKRSAIKTTVIVVGAGITGIILFVLATAGYVYYSSDGEIPDIYTQFYDEEYQKNFIMAMDKEGIPYRVIENKVWYSLSDQERVEKMNSKVLATLPVKYEFSDLDLLEGFLAALDEKNIEYSVYEADKGKSVILAKEYSVLASDAFTKVMSSR